MADEGKESLNNLNHKNVDAKRQEHPSRPKPRRVLILVLIPFVVILGLIIALGIDIHHHTSNDTYCDSLDPTDCIVAVQIYNDTDSLLTVKQCRGADNVPCNSFSEVATLPPSGFHRTNGTTDGDPEPWLVVNQQEEVVGCLNLEYTKYQRTPVSVFLSKPLACKKVNDAMAEFKKKYHAF